MTPQQDTRVLYILKHPIELKSADGSVQETISELGLRRLKARDMRALDNAKGGASMSLALLGASAGLPPSTIDQLDAEDFTSALSVVTDFLGGSLLTGAQ